MKELTKNINKLKTRDDGDNYLHTLEVITEIMLQMDDSDTLRNAEMIREFKHDRLKIQVVVYRKHPYNRSHVK